MTNQLRGYDWTRSYEWNYKHVPAPVEVDVPPLAGDWSFCGLPVHSPLGIPAGPLLNGAWCLYYASLGFDVLTYKTVRSRGHACYEMPNLQPVKTGPLSVSASTVPTAPLMEDNWAVSFGMPSKPPDVWRADVEQTRRALPAGKLLAVSVVGTMEEGWRIDELADDYATCAQWALQSGADLVETNFSCPNVSTCDGQLFQHVADAQVVAERVRERIGTAPLVIKIGHVSSRDLTDQLVSALGPLANGLAMTNSIAAHVVDSAGTHLFGGQVRGICGDAVRAESIRQVGRFRESICGQQSSLELVGVGGAGTAAHVLDYWRAGARVVQFATRAMRQPGVALNVRQDLAETTLRTLEQANS